nr:unnamed protein product [Callosobruchus chinensis]
MQSGERQFDSSVTQP